MATFRPFKAFRPLPQYAAEIASKPYDVLSSDEARKEAEGHPLSFLHVGKPEIDLDPSTHPYDPLVYDKAKENLHKLIENGHLVEDPEPFVYLYAQTMGGHTQYGLVGCASVYEYWNDVIRKHEHTRKDKEEDRCNHVRVTNSHSGPIFLTYPDKPEIDDIVKQTAAEAPENDFVAADGIRHQVWVIRDRNTIDRLGALFGEIPTLYVADGHHRSAAAAIVGKERAKANPSHTGKEEYNFFLAVFFPAAQLRIMDYNRVVKDLDGVNTEGFFKRLLTSFTVQKTESRVKPNKKGDIGLYIDGSWYRISANSGLLAHPDPVEKLDVSILQNHLLRPILDIDDPRTNKRIDFVGGIRGLEELERRVDSGEMKVAFSMFPTSINELISIADAGKVMPPKSTWFEPKLRDGLFVHFLD